MATNTADVAMFLDKSGSITDQYFATCDGRQPMLCCHGVLAQDIAR